MEWETVIGLEIHAQLATKSKIFSGAPIAYGAPPNTQACAVDLGLPGVLPVLNAEAVRMAVKFGLAVGAGIAPRSIFARKNYFYPDLPKGYQISQYELPVVAGGHVEIELEDGAAKTIGITRAHLEEDAGKSLHEDFHGMTGIDLNRAGTPLLEIVSEPDMRSAKEAVAYMKKIHSLVRYLEICDGNMQEGSFRCDANVSVRPKGREKLGTRAELKNINSFRFVEKAINYEVQRQIELLESGGTVVQETRLYDADQDETRPMRSKEEANDYRYFPDPDLLPLEIESAFIEQVRKSLPELPDEKKRRFINEHGLSAYEAGVLTASREVADYYEAVVRAGGGEAKLCANWVMGEFLGALNKDNLDITASPISPEQLGGMLRRITDNTISGKIAKQVFEAMWNKEGDADAIIEKKGLRQVTDTGAIEKVIEVVMAQFPEQLAQYRSGQEKLFAFFIGQVMKATQGKANPAQVNDLLKEKLNPYSGVTK
ncbi:MAG TPA: Asp-tRNA(Asn)/Glu-tRNA(Gln) amidotransferase subunit GatB [Gammaproteobacteria bacterium]|nr:Asp-tRNA(Asn)/Glu-tRNA(Gln) amidotransferase subunit GatB [Gammaproteobacteria bacterium]